MDQSLFPSRLLILDIDGLRQDTFDLALKDQLIPNLSTLLGHHQAVHLQALCPTPSITFCSQTTIFTGLHPDQHGIAGNQFYDRFGSRNHGVPRLYAYDIGDSLAIDDAVLVFSGPVGLLGETLPPKLPTLYEIAGRNGCSSVVGYHMLSRGASHWIRPNLADLARFIKGGGLFGLSAERFDTQTVDQVLAHLQNYGCPDILTAYFMGLDHQSHEHGPGIQTRYLSQVVDVQAGRLLEAYRANGWLAHTVVVIVSDHGHIRVIADDRHSLRLGFPFDREMGYLFDALGLDVHDIPGEDPACDAVVACNGGLAHIYLQHRQGRWQDPPRFQQDVIPVAMAFWEANRTGKYAPDLQGALSLILARDVEHQGWEAPYQVLVPGSNERPNLLPMAAYFGAQPEPEMLEANARLERLAGPHSGDLVLLSNYQDGFYFGTPIVSTHGGLHREESRAVLSFGWPEASTGQIEHLRSVVHQITEERRKTESRGFISLADMLPVLQALFQWR